MNNSVIFDLHVDIDDDKLDTDLGSYDWDHLPRALRTKIEFNTYVGKLKTNHKDYAKAIGADYFHFNRDDEWFDSIKEKYPYLSEYLIVNFYKLYLMERLAEDYDEVLYVDLDVYFHTNERYPWDLSQGIHLAARTEVDPIEHMQKGQYIYLRSELNKYLIAWCMMMEELDFYDGVVTNTGIIAADAHHIKRLAFTDNLDHMLNLINQAKDNDMYPDNVRASMDWNNEPMYSYIAQKNDVPLVDTEGPWNFIVNYDMDKETYDMSEKYITHMILKRFDWIWP